MWRGLERADGGRESALSELCERYADEFGEPYMVISPFLRRKRNLSDPPSGYHPLFTWRYLFLRYLFYTSRIVVLNWLTL